MNYVVKSTLTFCTSVLTNFRRLSVCAREGVKGQGSSLAINSCARGIDVDWPPPARARSTGLLCACAHAQLVAIVLAKARAAAKIEGLFSNCRIFVRSKIVSYVHCREKVACTPRAALKFG